MFCRWIDTGGVDWAVEAAASLTPNPEYFVAAAGDTLCCPNPFEVFDTDLDE